MPVIAGFGLHLTELLVMCCLSTNLLNYMIYIICYGSVQLSRKIWRWDCYFVFIKTLFLNKGQHLMYEAKVNSFNVSLVFTKVMESFVLDME